MKASKAVRKIAKTIAQGDQQYAGWYTCNLIWFSDDARDEGNYYQELFELTEAENRGGELWRKLWKLPTPELNELRVWMLLVFAAVLEAEGR